MDDEAIRRHRAMLAEWCELGHPNTAGCSGHTYPNLGCPAPEVHKNIFPEGRYDR